jgi:hypothetical protein
MYIIEGYPEFDEDVVELFVSPIAHALGLSISIEKIDNDRIILRSRDCDIHLSLSCEQSIVVEFANPISGRKYWEVILRIFFGKGYSKHPLEGEGYPLTMRQWIDFYAEDDFRSICRVDLPIIKDELLEDWRFILEGDFSFEEGYAQWEGWYEKAKLVEKDWRELSYEHFLKDQEGIND